MTEKKRETDRRPEERASVSGKISDRSCVLAFDTSNYTTSVALSDLSGKILADERIILTVRQGERGLRQSAALFQHMENLPHLLRRALEASGTESSQICAVAALSLIHISEPTRP